MTNWTSKSLLAAIAAGLAANAFASMGPSEAVAQGSGPAVESDTKAADVIIQCTLPTRQVVSISRFSGLTEKGLSDRKTYTPTLTAQGVTFGTGFLCGSTKPMGRAFDAFAFAVATCKSASGDFTESVKINRKDATFEYRKSINPSSKDDATSYETGNGTCSKAQGF